MNARDIVAKIPMSGDPDGTVRDPGMHTSILNLTKQLLAVRFNFVSELDLQDGIEQVLRRHKWTYSREFQLDSHNRIDFLLHNGLGVEVKLDPSLSAVTRQLFRYAAQPGINGLMLVTSQLRLNRLPPTIKDKPIHVVWIAGAGL